MRPINLRFILIVSLLAIALSQQSCAQNTISEQLKQLSVQDSLRVDKYLEKTEGLPIFSPRRGLYIDSALTIVPQNSYLWQQRAMPLFKQKKYEIAMPYLESAVKYNPKRYMDYRAFIKCIFQKKYTEAIKDFKSAQLLNGNSIVMDHSYDFYMGLCYLQLNKLDSAEYLIKSTIEEERKLRSNDSWIHFLHWFYLGIVLYEKEDYPTAIEHFDRCLKLYATFSDAKYYKAICLDNLEKSKEALTLMIEAENDFKKGYTITEDNAIYEIYPYQINKFYLSAYVEKLKEGN